MSITLKEIADLAGVSESTVSRALSNSPLISEKTKQLVFKAAQRLNYQPAKSTQWPTKVLGVVQPKISNPLYAEIIEAVQARAYEEGYNIILCDSGFDMEREQSQLELLLNQGVSGIILLPIDSNAEHVAKLIQQNIPCVIIGSEPIPGSDQVNNDVVMGAVVATRYLLELGHRHIALIGGPAQVSACRARLKGYKQALEEYHVAYDESLVVEGGLDENGGREAMAKLLPMMKKKITAVYAINDVMAIGALSKIREEGFQVPDDLSLVGSDDIPVAAQLQPALTTIWQPKRELGFLAAKLIIKQIETKQERGAHWREKYPFQTAMYLPHLVKRNSTCSPGGSEV